MAWETYDKFGNLKTGAFGPGGWEIIERHVFDGTDNGKNFNLDNSLYDQFELRYMDIFPNNDEANIRCKLSQDGGATFASGTYRRAGVHSTHANSTISAGNVTSTTEMTLNANGVGNGGNSTMNGLLEILNPGLANNGNLIKCLSQSGYGQFPDDNFRQTRFGYSCSGLSIANAVRFETNGATVTGQLILMGLPKVVNTQNGLVKPQGWTLIENRSHVALQDLVFDDFAGFGMLQLVCSEIQCTNSNSALQLQISNNGGSSFQTGSVYSSGGHFNRHGQSVVNYGSALVTGFQLNGAFSQSGFLANANRGAFYDIRLGQFNTNTSFSVFGKYPDNLGQEMTTIDGTGHWNAQTGTVDAFRLNINAGTFSGKFSLLGLAGF